jgi:hypothetical protein
LRRASLQSDARRRLSHVMDRAVHDRPHLRWSGGSRARRPSRSQQQKGPGSLAAAVRDRAERNRVQMRQRVTPVSIACECPPVPKCTRLVPAKRATVVVAGNDISRFAGILSTISLPCAPIGNWSQPFWLVCLVVEDSRLEPSRHSPRDRRRAAQRASSTSTRRRRARDRVATGSWSRPFDGAGCRSPFAGIYQ